MIIASEHCIADNGMQVQSSAHLHIEEIGVEKLPFSVTVSVDHSRMFTGHTATEKEAKEMRKQMHASYLEVHSSAA